MPPKAGAKAKDAPEVESNSLGGTEGAGGSNESKQPKAEDILELVE